MLYPTGALAVAPPSRGDPADGLHGIDSAEPAALPSPRVRTTGPDGIFLIYDAPKAGKHRGQQGVDPSVDEASGDSRADDQSGDSRGDEQGGDAEAGDAESVPGRNAYLAWWRDYADGGVYIFGRRMYTLADVGHALFALERDLGIDIDPIAASHERLEVALIMASWEPPDESGWLLGTRGTVFNLMGVRLRPGESEDGDGSVLFSHSGPCFPASATGPEDDGRQGDRTRDGDSGKEGRRRRGSRILLRVEAMTPLPPLFEDVASILDDVARGVEPVEPCDENPCTWMNCDDGNSCTRDRCEDGACIHNELTGYSCRDDGNECTLDYCINGVCSHPPYPDGTCCGCDISCLCIEDADPCTTDECQGGVCTSIPVPDGSWCPDDGNECTYDYCIGGSCQHPPKPDETSCTSDEDPCTKDECQGGTCKHPDKCPGVLCCGGWCCDDPPDPPVCCSESLSPTCCNDACCYGDCQNDSCCTGDWEAAASGGLICCPPCKDACGDGCCAGLCCQGDCCYDGNACTVDRCVCGDQSCTFRECDWTNPCDDGNSCTYDDCYAGPSPNCDEDFACENPPRPDGTACDDDGNECTYDYCVNGICDHPDKPDGTACDDDGRECTYDYCVNGTCDHPDKPDGTVCTSDGQACTNDVCNNGFCTHPAKCPAGEVCCGTDCCAPELCCGSAGAASGVGGDEAAAAAVQFCCALPCDECIDRGSLSGGTVSVSADPVCIDDTIIFTASGVEDSGGYQRENCVEQDIAPGTINYEWTITKPDDSTVEGSGPVATIVADQPGTYTCRFTAETKRDCPPLKSYTLPAATARVADVETLVWETFPGNDELDGCPNNGGMRIFPGKRSPTDGAAGERRKVNLKATISPAVEGGCMVYFKVWDVDDPFDQLYGCPGPTPDGRPCLDGADVIDAQNSTAGPDNRPTGEAPWTPPGVRTDTNGEAYVTFTVSMQPGNNYRAGASVVQTALNATTQTQADANNPPDNVVFSDMLTVWRKLHVEVDSMAAVDWTAALSETSNAQNGEIPTAPTFDPATGRAWIPIEPLHADFEATDQHRVGKLYILTYGYFVTDRTDESGPKVRIINAPANIVNAAGLPYTLWDDDKGSDPNANPPFVMVGFDAPPVTLPKVPDTGLMAEVFQNAYVDVPPSDMQYYDTNTGFDRNVADDEAANKAKENRDLTSADDFWAVHMTSAFQGFVDKDNDPDTEQGAPQGLQYGVTKPTGFLSGRRAGSLVFLETIRDDKRANAAAMSLLERYTVTHEAGHQFLLEHEDGQWPPGDDEDPAGDYIMTNVTDQTGMAPNVTFSPTSLNKIRGIEYPPQP